MSDNPYTPSSDDDAEAAPPQGALQKFANLPWQGVASDFADHATGVLQDYENTKVLADINDHNANAFMSSVTAYKNSLVQRAQADPMFVHAALNLAHNAAGNLVDGTPGLDGEAADAAHSAISQDWRQEIAHAAVQSLGLYNEEGARALLNHPDIAPLLDQDKLGNELSLYAMGRGVDQAARQKQAVFDTQDAQAAASLGHMRALYDGATDEVRFPPYWALAGMVNQAIPPSDTNDLLHLYGRLQSNGDAPASNPSTVSQLLNRISNSVPIHQSEIIGHAATNLRMADALHLARGALPLPAQDRYSFSLLGDAVNQGRRALMGTDNENGAAGFNAWSRYVNWLLPAVRRGQTGFTADTHPMNSISNFLPTGDDLPGPPRTTQPRSLADIFGGRR